MFKVFDNSFVHVRAVTRGCDECCKRILVTVDVVKVAFLKFSSVLTMTSTQTRSSHRVVAAVDMDNLYESRIIHHIGLLTQPNREDVIESVLVVVIDTLRNDTIVQLTVSKWCQW